MMVGPYAFFFNAAHSELDRTYGLPCTSKIVSAAQLCGLDVKSQVLRGDLLPHLLAYKPKAVSKKKSASRNRQTISHTMSPDMGLYRLILCDFAESLTAGWHTVDTIQFPFEISLKRIWTIVLPSISQEVAERIDGQTRDFGPYMGATSIDTGNPIHVKLFSLVGGTYIHNSELYYSVGCLDGHDEETSVANSYGSINRPIFLTHEEFELNAPAALKSTMVSTRGHLSVRRYEGKSALTHGQKLVHALLEYLQNNRDVDGVFYCSDLGCEGRFLCDESKVKNYLLNLEHPDGGAKARFFIETLGIEREDWKFLADQISGAMSSALIFRVNNKVHGISHGAFIKISGRNNRTAIIQTGWMVKTGEAPRLITAYPHSAPVDDKFDVPLQNISPLGLTGNSRWADIYERAHRAGQRAAHACTPTPLTLSSYSPIFAGQCGSAWVTVPDARRGMAKWLKDHNVGHKNHKAGWDVPANPIPSEDDQWDQQSIEPKKAYAEAFRNVLIDNGVECEIDSRLD